MDGILTEQQKLDLARSLQIGWRRYIDLLGEPPHGTEKQLLAMLELTPLMSLVRGIQNKAVDQYHAEGQR